MKVKVTGIKKVVDAFNKIGEEGVKMLDDITAQTANEFAGNAKRLAPIDLGKLRQGIVVNKLGVSKFEIVSTAPYSAYMEFGTGGLVNVPKVFEGQAAQFIGKGVKKVNIRPQPFMYPSYLKARKQYPIDLKDRLEFLIKKNNG